MGTWPLTWVDRPADRLTGDQQVSRGQEMSQLPGLGLARTQPSVFSFLINKISNRGGTRYFETFRDENEILTWRHEGSHLRITGWSHLTGPLMMTPLSRFLSRHCWGPHSDNKTLQFRETVLVNCEYEERREREGAHISHFSGQTLVIITAAPRG